MKTITVILLALIFLSTTFIPSEKNTVEGLLYSDNGFVSITLENGKISELQKSNTPENSPEILVAPGLIDIQINGFMGVDFSGPDLTVEGVKKATKALWKAGITTYFPTVITSDIDLIKKNFAILAEARKDPEIGASIPGFHLEGPYISPLAGFRGAHLEKYIKIPNWDEFQEIQIAADNGIILLTLAPELEGAIPFIKKCVASGVTISLGHHNGSAAEVQLAVEAGAKMATHLGNGCANEINRHYNPLWPQLSNDAITATISAVGFHLTREEVRTF
ncbi:MAG: amidohydrolase family protein [Flavobacteriaceae bacterium]